MVRKKANQLKKLKQKLEMHRDSNPKLAEKLLNKIKVLEPKK